MWEWQRAMRNRPGLRAALIRTLRPEPPDHRHEHGNRAPYHRPWSEDRSDEQNGGGNRRQKRPDGRRWKLETMIRLGIENVRNQYVAHIRPEPDDHGLIRFVVPDRLASADGSRADEIAVRRRRTGGPFERARAPWVVACHFAGPLRSERIEQEKDHAAGHEHGAKARREIERAPAHRRRVRVDTPRHSMQA